MKTKFWRVFFGLWFLLIPILAEAKTIKIAWDAVTTNSDGTPASITGYKVYFSPTKTAVTNKTAAPVNVNGKTCYCFDASETNPVVYIGVTAYDSSAESNMLTGFYLFGDVNGDAVFNYGVAWSSTRVDGTDLTVIGMYFGQTVAIPAPYDCNSCTGTITLTSAQRADLNGDGRIDGRDLVLLGLRFGNAA